MLMPAVSIQSPPRITHRQVAAAIGVTPATLYRYCRGKKIAFYRIGNRNLYAIAEVERFISACENLREGAGAAA